MKKITVQPTIRDLKPEPPKEPVIAFTVRLPLSLWQELDKVEFEKQYIVRKAIEAFLK